MSFLMDRWNSPERVTQRYTTQGTTPMLGQPQFQQLLAAYNNRKPVRGLTTTGEGEYDTHMPFNATLGGYQIEAFGPNKDMYRVYQNLPDGAEQQEFNGKNFDVYGNNGQYIGTHQFQNVGTDPVLNALDGFWDKAIPIATMAFIGGGAAGAFGGAATGATEGGAAGGLGEGAAAGLSTGGGGFGSAGQVFGGNLGGAGYGIGGVGSSLGGASGLGGLGWGSSVIPAGMGYNIPGLGSSLLEAGAAGAGSSVGAGLPPAGGGGGGGGAPATGGTTSGGGVVPPNPYVTPSNLGDLLKTLGGGNALSLGSLLGPAASLLNGYLSSKATDKATEAQLQAAREAAAMFEPWRNAGGWSIGQAATMLGKNGPVAAKNAFYTSPDYEFRRSEGEKSLTRAAAASGGLGSGKFLKDYNRFNQDLASTEFGNSLNRLLAVAGMGQTATGSTADYRTQAANAQAAGAVGKANAWGNALTQGTSMYNNYQQQQQNNALMAAILSGRT